jgi:hypothetical protein
MSAMTRWEFGPDLTAADFKGQQGAMHRIGFSPGPGQPPRLQREEEPRSGAMSPEIVTGLFGAAASAVLAILNGLLTSRSQVAEEVRTKRLDCYPQPWKLTSMLCSGREAIPPGPPALQRAQRRWYFEVGGLGGMAATRGPRNLKPGREDRPGHAVVNDQILVRNWTHLPPLVAWT